ncbi:Hypothetical predicted protein [Podarcis lilfordi]|uniref:Uncharacterized protein n=1 Tax=Podarcis lilfordi TaxID=74358 RepID=A0AA35JUS6_9SAUR|nr:Hypothetical predicted protein [Podarcis lilfordi]
MANLEVNTEFATICACMEAASAICPCAQAAVDSTHVQKHAAAECTHAQRHLH